ncbi:MAG: hypothetical protein QM790_07095 [Nibricoccus sp.]
MTKFLRFSCVAIAAVLASRLLAGVNLLDLVDEQCPVVISVQDMPALVKNWEQSPWAKTWNDEQMRKFLAPLRAEMKIDHWDESCKAETGYTVSELLAMAKGQLMVALMSADFDVDAASPEIPVLIAIELGANTSKVAKIIAENDAKEHTTVKKEDFGGVELHIYQKSADDNSDDFVWAMDDGIWLLSPSKTTIQKTIDAMKKGRVASPLSGSDRYLQVRKRNPDANVTLLANVQAIYPVLKTAAEKQAEGKGATMGMPPGAILDAVGLATLRDLYLSVEVGEGATSISGGLTYSELKGLFKMMAYKDGPVAQPGFVSEKWIAASSMNFSFPEAYGALKEFLEALNPMISGIVQAQVKNLNQQLGIDLERDLIGSLGTSVIVGTAPRPGASEDSPTALSEMDQFYSVSLGNPVSFTKAVDAIKRMMGPQAESMLTKREYLGQTIYTAASNGKPGQMGFSYAITPKYLFVSVGSASAIETAVQGLAGKQPSLWQKSEVKAALNDLPANASAFEYQNTRRMVGSMIETLVQLAPLFNSRSRPMAQDEENDAPARAETPSGAFDLSAKPDSVAISKYWNSAFGYAWRTSQGIFIQSKVNHPK